MSEYAALLIKAAEDLEPLTDSELEDLRNLASTLSVKQEITVVEARERKRLLEQNIAQLLKEFTDTTHISVTEIWITPNVIGSASAYGIQVDIDL